MELIPQSLNANSLKARVKEAREHAYNVDMLLDPILRTGVDFVPASIVSLVHVEVLEIRRLLEMDE